MSKVKARFSVLDLDVQNRTTVYNGYLRVDKLSLKHRLVEGGWSPMIQRELQVKGAAVAILLFDPVLDQVVMVRQFRVGMVDEGQSPWLLETVAGMIEIGEEPEDVARRETKEEADVEITDIIKVCEYYNSPGTTNEKVYLFCAKVDSSKASGVHGLEQENEDIEVVVLKFAELVEAVETGHISNAMTIIGTQWLEKNKASVISAWK